MIFPGGLATAELQQAATERVKRDVGKFVIFGLLVEAGKLVFCLALVFIRDVHLITIRPLFVSVAYGASYLSIEGFLT
ncbi:unnamed protein product [Angiostrongylus costaricensis]|uniref:GDT1 family protein n=1 Tax=Angiostrongylus costaricensis TaxID=334426 RepID=A0A0R3PQM6_ANGCS|nr:unnamed protein product [Angiostrongylus costaricensis]